MKKEPFRFTLFLLICLSLLMIGTAQAVDVPDPNLRAAIETTLGKASGTPITAAEMETLTFFRAIDANISDLTGLEYATNLTYLFLWNNAISDLTPLSDLTNLQFLDLQGNSVSDLSPVMGLTNLIFLGIRDNSVSELSPLVANTELGEKNGVNVEGNLLNYPSIYTHIPTLQSRGVEVRFDSRTPTTLEIISGDAQSDTVGVALAQPFVVEVRDGNDLVFEGVPVVFTITAGGGIVQPEITTTDANGLAQSILTLGSDPGTNTVTVGVEGIAQTVVFSAEASLPPPVPTVLSIVSGDNQSGLTGEALVNPFVVEVQDQNNAPMGGVAVTFAVSKGSGSLSPETGLTAANGQAESQFTLGSNPGMNTVTVSVEGITETATFNAEASLPPPMPTALEGVSGNNQSGLTGEPLMNPFVVEVHDQYDDPMEGVTVTFAVSGGSGSLSSEMGITDANGQAESTLTLGNDPGTNTVTASVEGLSQMVVFNAEASLPPPMATSLKVISGDNQTGLTSETLMNPFVVEVHDQYDEPMEGVTVTFVVSAGGGSVSDISVNTDANGLAQSTLILGSDPGTNTVEASIGDLSQTFNAEAALPPPMATSLKVISGDNQTGLTGETLMNPFVVEVRDQYDDPMEGVTVTFAVSTGGGSLSDMSVDTDANGLAQSTLTLGSDPGTNTVTASVEGLSQMVVFNAEASLPPPMATSLEGISGNNQTDLTGERLMNPFVVEIRDQYDDPMEGVTVAFIVSAGGGSLSSQIGMTDANGRAESTLTLGSDPGGYTVEVSVEGIAETATFNAEASLPPPVPTTVSILSGENQEGLTGEPLMTPFIVEVRDQYDDPMEGVTVTFALLTSGGSLSSQTGMTDANGRAESTLTLGGDPGGYTVTVSVEGISQMAIFSAEASLPPPEPTVLSIISGDNQSGLTGEALANPFVVQVRDQYDAPMEGVTVTFVVSVGGGSVSDTSVNTDANGLAQSTLILGSDPGTNTVEASIGDLSQTFNAEAALPPPMATSLEVISGDNQSGLTGEPLMNPFVVEARDQYDDPMEDVTVAFIVSAGGGSLSSQIGMTDANGRAESTLTLGNDPGTNTVTASVEGLSQMVVFNAEAALPPPMATSLEVISGDNQSGLTSETLMTPFVVEVHDQYDTPMESVTVTFAVSGGSGSLSSEVGITDANGQAESTLTLGNDPGTNTVTASVEGLSQMVVFNAEASLPPPMATSLKVISGDNQTGLTSETLMTPFVVEVRDQYDTPMEGVTVTFAVSGGGGMLSDISVDTDANGLAQSTLTLGSDPGGYTVTVSVEGITEIVAFNAIAELLEFDLSVPVGLSLIHIPLKVRAVDGIAGTIESVGDLYDALGGASTVNFLITYDSQAQEWRSYFGASDTGTAADRTLTDDMGIIAGMKSPTSIQLKGDALGTNGKSTITLTPGLNVVGLPLNDSRINRVSDLLRIDGIWGNVSVIILTDGGEFKAVGWAGDPGDIEITGGQAFILFAREPAMVAISGEAWTNVSGTTSAPSVGNADLHSLLTGLQVPDTTPVLALTGSIVDARMGGSQPEIRVILKNLSTGREVAAVTGGDEASYQLTIVDIETGRAAQIGDILEISAISSDASIGVEPLRYTVTAEDVERSLIQLPALVAYEMPAETALLHNYPNPFNPETWIPYRLAEDALVTLTIYDGAGQVVRTIDLGHQTAAVYESRSKAIYWDGRNEVGETVASGVYFYHLSAGDYSATRKMLILK